MKDLIISLSGIRGIVKEALTEKQTYKAVNLFFKYYLQSQKKPLNIIIGQDIKPSGENLLKGATSALYDNGIKNITHLGITTLPIIEWAVKHLNANAGIFITASHNPIQWNGLKFISSSGDSASILPADIMQKIKDEWKESKTEKINISQLPAESLCTKEYNKDVIEKIKKTIDLCSEKTGEGNNTLSKIKEKQFKIALDACSKEGLQIPKSFLMSLGIKEKNIYSLNAGELSECKRRLEPSPEYLSELKETIKRESLDIGFAFDPDQDRLVIMPLWSEELTPILCAKFLLELQKESNNKYIKKIAINLSTSSLWETMAKEYGVDIIRTRVGEFNVVEAMQKHNLPFGAEGNGGVILKDISAGRNSTVGMVLILAYMTWRNLSIEKLEKELPRCYMLKRKQTTTLPQEKMGKFLDDKMKYFISQNKDRIKEIDMQDGYRIVFNDNSWAHVRTSNTEPAVRLIIEAKKEQTVKVLTSQLKDFLLA